MLKLVDKHDSKSCGIYPVWVRFPPLAQNYNNDFRKIRADIKDLSDSVTTLTETNPTRIEFDQLTDFVGFKPRAL